MTTITEAQVRERAQEMEERWAAIPPALSWNQSWDRMARTALEREAAIRAEMANGDERAQACVAACKAHRELLLRYHCGSVSSRMAWDAGAAYDPPPQPTLRQVAEAVLRAWDIAPDPGGLPVLLNELRDALAREDKGVAK